MDPNQFIKQFDENKQISKTGSRALVMLLHLLDGPKNFKEISQFLQDCGIVVKEYSVDTIRIDIRALKTIGCDITKATKKNDNKYRLISHPFNLQLTSEDVDMLKLVYKKVLKNCSAGKVLKYHKLFEKMSRLVNDEKIRQEILGISIYKHENINIIEDLVSSETINNKTRILYNPPNHNEPVEYDITIETLGLRSGRLYVFCYNHTTGKRSFLNVSRISSVVSNMFDRTSEYGLDVRIKFMLKNYKHYKLQENEYISKTNGEDALVEGFYFNDFIAIQRILSFASDCTVIEPYEVVDSIKDKLLKMRAVYEG